MAVKAASLGSAGSMMVRRSSFSRKCVLAFATGRCRMVQARCPNSLGHVLRLQTRLAHLHTTKRSAPVQSAGRAYAWEGIDRGRPFPRAQPPRLIWSEVQRGSFLGKTVTSHVRKCPVLTPGQASQSSLYVYVSEHCAVRCRLLACSHRWYCIHWDPKHPVETGPECATARAFSGAGIAPRKGCTAVTMLPRM